MAVSDPTTNFGWLLPNDGGDDGAWGAQLREIHGAAIGDAIPGIDAILFRAETTADAALARAGGSMSGEIDVLTERFVTVDLGSTMSGTITMDLDASNSFHGTVTGSVTFAFSNVPASPDWVYLTLEITNGGSQSVSFPSSVDWPGGTPPTLTVSGVDVITMYTRDGGTTWRAALAMANSS